MSKQFIDITIIVGSCLIKTSHVFQHFNLVFKSKIRPDLTKNGLQYKRVTSNCLVSFAAFLQLCKVFKNRSHFQIYLSLKTFKTNCILTTFKAVRNSIKKNKNKMQSMVVQPQCDRSCCSIVLSLKYLKTSQVALVNFMLGLVSKGLHNICFCKAQSV